MENFDNTIKNITSNVQKIGKNLIKQLFTLYYCATDSDTPLSVKVAIFSLFVYVINPIDIIPDLTPVVGYADDASATAGIFAAYAFYITPEHYKKAEERVNLLFNS